MKSKAIEILRAIAEDNNNPSHSNMSLAQQAAVKCALHELEQPEPSVVHPLLEAMNTHIRKLVDERVEHAVNDALKDMDERIEDMDNRIERVENAENEDLTDLQSRMDDVEAYESRIDDLESAQRNDDDDQYRELEIRIDDLESTINDHDEYIDEVKKENAAIMRGERQTDEWSNRMEQRLDTLEAASKLGPKDIVLACIDYIRERIA